MSLYFLALLLGAIWAIWFSIVFLTNLFDGLKALGILPESWKFDSGNLGAIQKATSDYNPPGWLNGLLFGGVILWQALITALFWWALARSAGGVLDLPALRLAFGAGISLFGAFLIADEIFKDYRSARDHSLLFAGQLITVIFLHLA